MSNLITEWRRFEIVSKTKDEENKFLKLIDEKNLSKEELMLILRNIKIRSLEGIK